MSNLSETSIHDPQFLRMQIDLHRVQSPMHHELRTLCGRHLYFHIAQTLHEHPANSQCQSLKRLNDLFTERALRQRIREFELSGLVQLNYSTIDKRTKHLVATPKIIRWLNEHMQLLRHTSERHMHLIERI